MELIKQIKQAETKAQETIERAKVDVARQIQQGRENGQKALAEAEVKRKKAIEDAVSAAQSQGEAEVEQMKTQAKNNHKQLWEKVSGKIPPAAAKVVDYLKG